MLKILKCWNFYVPKRYHSKKRSNTEMKYLNVAEKNDAAKTIAGQLSNGTARRREGYSVYNKIYEFEAMIRGTKSKMVMTSVSGHLLQLEFLNSYRNWNNVDPKSLFEAPIRKTCGENFINIKRTLEREVRGCQGLIIWTDCDREGENIGFEIIDVCRAVKPNITVYRAIFSEITGTSVKRALQNLTAPDKRQSDAVDVRTELDLRTGAAITRFQTMRLQRLFPEKISNKLISYGSCQIPTLGFVAERYKEIEAFVSEPFWKIKVTHTIGDLTVEFTWARNRLFDKQLCEDYYLLVISNPKATVESVTVKPKSKWRPTPMDTVELEKLGSRKLKLSAKEVMTIAEKLYTKGIISYPRTETNMFSKEIDLKGLVEQQTAHGVWGSFAQRVAEWGPNPRNGTKSDQAHPPIHPTKMVPSLDGNEGRVYELICRHFLACISKDAVGSETVVTITIEGEKFTANGLVIFERNYLDIYVYDKWNAKQIHKYEQGQVFEPTEITMPEGATTAPPLLTEADLITLMEKHGIGTDATHAEHINTIKERGYIGVVDNGCLVPGVIGMGLYEGYDAMELVLAKPLLRAEFEKDLKKICLGEKDPNVVLGEQIVKYKEAYKQIMDKITAMDVKMSERLLETPTQRNNAANSNNPTASNDGGSGDFENSNRIIQELFKCPKCSVAHLALKPKKNQSGFFLGCLNYPDCKNVIWLPDECKDPSVLEETCSKCGSEFKLIKFKFSSAYHKSLFNAQTGWYKTCLRCDVQFRNTFNINLESVKRVGPIVADSTTIPINYGTALPSGSTGNGNNSVNRPKQDSTKTKKTKGTDTETKAKKPRKTAIKTSTTTANSNIRSYFTSAQQQSAQEIAANELENIPIDAFFDSNDGFDDLIFAAEANIPSSSRKNKTSSNKQSATTHTHPESVLSDELAAAFNDDNDDVFADFQWNSGNQQDTNFNNQRQNTTTTTSSSSLYNRGNTVLDDSFSSILRGDNDLDDEYVWGSAAKNAKITQTSATTNEPAAKRPKIQTTATRTEEDFSWGASTRIQTETAVNVNCNGCHQPAKELSVKKDGPNKGRLFYVCSKSNPCKFFQWADEIDQNPNSNPQSNNTTSNTQSWSSNSRSVAASNAPSGSWGSRDMDMPDDSPQVNCNCNKPASSLTVRKDGPNQGRGFYACPDRNKSCGFFKWADDNQDNSQSSWGNSAASTSSANKKPSSSSTGTSKARKCGLCRQEGHSRQKCPRKAEFEF